MKTDSSKSENGLFGSFYLGASEYAISAEYVQEVVNSPVSFTTVPLAPLYMKGLFNLRGTMIPVLDLRKLLKVQGPVNGELSKIAILKSNKGHIGLLFDRTGEVFRAAAQERSDFDFDFNFKHESTLVTGLFKKEGGSRIIQILDGKKIFTLQNNFGNADALALAEKAKLASRGGRKKCISFTVGPSRCALAISDIQEILKVEKINESVLVGGHCIGAISLRGAVIPVIDCASLLDFRAPESAKNLMPAERRLIVMKLDSLSFALMVDTVESIVSFFSDEVLPFNLVQQKKSEMFLGCISMTGEQEILLLDQTKILSDSEVKEITKGHNHLYKNGSSSVGNEKGAQSNVRHTYVTFNIDNSYAVAIDEIKEIIDYPKTLLHPPGLKDFYRGILNLRGDLITILDIRSMYDAAATTVNSEKSKVLVFKCNNIQFGLIVESVESIVSFTESNKMRIPEIFYSSKGPSIANNVSEAVQITDVDGSKKSLLILSPKSIAERIMDSVAA